jgi:hypothetical protein
MEAAQQAESLAQQLELEALEQAQCHQPPVHQDAFCPGCRRAVGLTSTRHRRLHRAACALDAELLQRRRHSTFVAACVLAASSTPVRSLPTRDRGSAYAKPDVVSARQLQLAGPLAPETATQLLTLLLLLVQSPQQAPPQTELALAEATLIGLRRCSTDLLLEALEALLRALEALLRALEALLRALELA